MEPVIMRVMAVLLLALPALLAAPSSDDAPENITDAANYDFDADLAATARGQGFFDGFSRGYSRLGKKMILPLLVGILLKVASFVPLILGKLSLLALASIIASKLALLISALVGAKKLHSATPYSYSHHHGGHGDWATAASNMYAELAHPMAAAANAYGAAAAYGGQHRRVAPSSAPGGTHAFSSLAAQLNRGTGYHLGRSLGSRAASTQSPGADESLPTPPPAATTTAKPEARRRRGAIRG